MQIIGLILLAGLVIYAFKQAVMLLILAGLIFRTKETVGLLLICAILTGLAAYPLLGFGLLIAIAVTALVKAVKKDRSARAIDDPDQE